MASKKVVLITGCTEGSLGDALAQAFHERGLRVIATARSPAKMAHLKAKGLDTLPLDVLSSDSVSKCVDAVNKMTSGRLDILVNNSGRGYSMPLADASLQETRDLFELNVLSVLAVTQAFLPLLLESRGMIVNQTSISSVAPVPMTGIYNASKAAASHLTDTLRLELAPFGVKVIDLKTGVVQSGFFRNINGGTPPKLPEHSIYAVSRESVEACMAGQRVEKDGVPGDKWARHVVGDLLKSRPNIRVWRGGNAWLMWFSRRFMPFTFLDDTMSKHGGLDDVKRQLAKQR